MEHTDAHLLVPMTFFNSPWIPQRYSPLLSFCFSGCSFLSSFMGFCSLACPRMPLSPSPIYFLWLSPRMAWVLTSISSLSPRGHVHLTRPQSQLTSEPEIYALLHPFWQTFSLPILPVSVALPSTLLSKPPSCTVRITVRALPPSRVGTRASDTAPSTHLAQLSAESGQHFTCCIPK